MFKISLNAFLALFILLSSPSNAQTKVVVIPYFSAARIDNYIRISIGTDEEMNSLVKALTEILAI